MNHSSLVASIFVVVYIERHLLYSRLTRQSVTWVWCLLVSPPKLTKMILSPHPVFYPPCFWCLSTVIGHVWFYCIGPINLLLWTTHFTPNFTLITNILKYICWFFQRSSTITCNRMLTSSWTFLSTTSMKLFLVSL